jgi:DNA adenine methylase
LRLTQPLKWPGGGYYKAPKIIEHMPRHLHYVETCFGGGSVLLTRDPEDERLWWPGHKGVSELINDINGEITNFWLVLREPDCFAAFRRKVEAIPLSANEWDIAGMPVGLSPIDKAVNFFVRCRQSRSGAGKTFTSITRNRLRRGMNGNVSEWLGSVDGLPDVHARLRRVLIENMPAVELIKREDTPHTLFYIDPPFWPESRISTDLYQFEMTAKQHLDLAEVLNKVKGKVMLSGYRSDAYDRLYEGWRRVEFDLPNHMAGGKSKRRMVECLWMNY